MAMEFFSLMSDLGGYLGLGVKKAVLPRIGQGVDYTDKKYENLARQVVSRIHPDRMRLRLTEVIRETPTTKTFRFERTDGPPPPYRAGQYVNLFIEINGVKTSRPYSIASPPGSDLLDLTVRDKPGGFVAPYLLSEVKVGDEFETTGPSGSFYHEPLIDGTNLVFLAGGSGITPLMSIIRGAAVCDWPLKITLLYGCRVPNDVIYSNELKGLSKNSDKFKYALVISEPPEGYRGLKGFLDAEVVRKQVGDVEGKTFYVCGPNVMYDFCQPVLEKLGVPRHKIKRELYGPPDDVTKEPGWPEDLKSDTIFNVEVAGGKTIQAPAGEPLINSLERNGLAVPAVCRSGECSACRTKLVSGRVFMPPHTGIRESDKSYGYIHACVSYPVEDCRLKTI